MRAAFSLLALVIVAAVVLSVLKKQSTQLKPPAAASAPAAPEAVGQRVQRNVDDAVRRTTEAASASMD